MPRPSAWRALVCSAPNFSTWTARRGPTKTTVSRPIAKWRTRSGTANSISAWLISERKSAPRTPISPVNRNPSLGVRGVRLLLARTDILEPQVKALARIALMRPLTVLLPMIDTVDTLLQMRGELCRICGVAEGDRLPFQLGSMIEVPSAALLIEDIIGHIDSVSVGLNDLTQYLLAADRDDEFVESYHDPLQPVVLRLLHQLVEVSNTYGKPVTMCGELAGDPKLTALLLALGVRRISVSRSHVGRIGAAVGSLAMSDIAALGPAVLKCSTGHAVRQLLHARHAVRNHRVGSPF